MTAEHSYTLPQSANLVPPFASLDCGVHLQTSFHCAGSWAECCPWFTFTATLSVWKYKLSFAAATLRTHVRQTIVQLLMDTGLNTVLLCSTSLLACRDSLYTCNWLVRSTIITTTISLYHTSTTKSSYWQVHDDIVGHGHMTQGRTLKATNFTEKHTFILSKIR